MDYNNPNDYWQPRDPLDDDDGHLAEGCFTALVIWLAFAIAAVAILALTSCKTTEYVPVIDHQTDTLIITKQQRDSIYMHDSIFVKQQGDTLTIERWHTKYVESIKHDTLYQSRIDSIPVPYPVETIKEVPAELTWWQQTRMHLGGILIFVAMIFALFKWGIPLIRKFFS